MRPVPRLLAVLLTAAAVLWVAALFFASAPGAGRSGVLADAIRAVGSVVCHQRPDRSFHVAGVQLPVCARCAGLYVAGALGALLAWVGTTGVPERTRTLLLLAAVPTAATLIGEWARLIDPGNIARAMAALPLGGASGWLFVRMLRAEERSSTCAIIQ